MTFFVPVAIVLIVMCLAGSFMLSLAEASLLAVSRHEMNREARRGDRAARLVLQITERSDFVSVVIVGATVLNLAIANLMTQVVRHYVGPGTGLVGALPHVAMLAVILVLAELWPKTYGSMRAGASARAMAGVMHRLIRLLAPMVSLMDWVSNGVMRLFGLGTEYHRSFATPGEIQAAVDMGEEEGIVEPEEGEMLDNVIELSEQTVKDVMVARVDIMAAPESMSVEEIVPLAIESGFSRIPVYADSIDHITGVVYVNDIIVQLSQENMATTLGEISRTAVLVPESKRLDEMFSELRQRKVHIAIVIDEFGATEGLVTIEDILEELVGDIEDEHDPVDEDIVIVNEREAIATGKTRLEEINAALGIDLSTEVHDTIGGLLAGMAGRVPQDGEVLTALGVRFEIEDSDDQYLERVRVIAPADQEAEE